MKPYTNPLGFFVSCGINYDLVIRMHSVRGQTSHWKQSFIRRPGRGSLRRATAQHHLFPYASYDGRNFEITAKVISPPSQYPRIPTQARQCHSTIIAH
jgi:hypothetical protein